jgi:hypothetical protein
MRYGTVSATVLWRWMHCFIAHERFEDTKGVIRIRKSKKTDNTMAERKIRTTIIYYTLHRKRLYESVIINIFFYCKLIAPRII